MSTARGTHGVNVFFFLFSLCSTWNLFICDVTIRIMVTYHDSAGDNESNDYYNDNDNMK